MSALPQYKLIESPKIFFACDSGDFGARQFVQRRLKRADNSLTTLKFVEDSPFSKPWLLRTEDRIRQASLVICLIGERTWLLNSVDWELTLAKVLGKPIVGLRIHAGHMHPCPNSFSLYDYPIFGTDQLADVLTLLHSSLNMKSQA